MIDIELQKLIQKYESTSKPIQFDFRAKLRDEIANHFGDGKKYLHYIHPYPGRISPHIPFVILSLKEFENLSGYVLDPFAGTGTVLFESIINPFKNRSALGVEINPIGRLISKVKTTYYDIEKLELYFNKVKKSFNKSRKKDYKNVEFPNIEMWFSNKAISKLSKLRHAITEQRFSKDYKDFFWVNFSKIIRKVAKADPRIPPPVILKPYKYNGVSSVHEKLVEYLAMCEDPPVWEYFEQAFIENCKLARYAGKEQLFSSKATANIIGDNANELKVNLLNGRGQLSKERTRKLSKESIDIILTSPPYISAQKYIRSTKLELFWLGYSSDELLAFEKRTIGSEYVSMAKDIREIGVKSIDNLIGWTYKKSKERGIMVFDYFNKMDLAIKEMYRVLINGGYLVFVMGDNKILGRHIKTYKLISQMAESNGFEELITLKDLIRNRSMITKRNGTGGLIKNEYITILHKEV